MPTLNEGQHAGEFLVSEANKTRSRDVATLAEGQNLAAGTVLGRLTVGGAFVALNPGVEPADGSEIAAGILFDNVDATDAATEAVIIARDAEVNGGELVWPTGISGGDQATATGQLAALGIIVR